MMKLQARFADTTGWTTLRDYSEHGNASAALNRALLDLPIAGEDNSQRIRLRPLAKDPPFLRFLCDAEFFQEAADQGAIFFAGDTPTFRLVPMVVEKVNA